MHCRQIATALIKILAFAGVNLTLILIVLPVKADTIIHNDEDRSDAIQMPMQSIPEIIPGANPNVLPGSGFSIGTNFTGVSLRTVQTLNGFGIIPPDTMGAVGPNDFVEFVNGAFADYNKSNGTARQLISDTRFWQNVVGISSNLLSQGVTDPRVLYDPVSQRWFAAEITAGTGNNNILIAVSGGSAPTGWKGVSFAADSGTNFGDYPTLGLNANGVYLATSNFNSSDNFVDTTVVSIPKANLLLPTPTAANKTTFDHLQSSRVGFTVQPTVDLSGSTSSNEILLSSNFGSSNVLHRTDLLNTSGPGASITGTTNISVTSYDNPPLASQPDGTRSLDSGDTRLSSNVYKVGNNLWVAHSTVDFVTGRDDIQWFEIDATTNNVLQSGNIGDSTHDYYYPSIAANQSGNVVIGFTRSGTGSTDFPSSYAVVGRTVGNLTTFSSPQLLHSGNASYNLTFGGSRNRWGDYSATTIDPTDPFSFWTIQEYAAASNNWVTQITQIRVVPEPSEVLGTLAFGTLGAGYLLKRQFKKATV